MTPEEIIQNITDQWNAESEYRFKKHQSDMVMHLANKVLTESLSVSDKIVKMDNIAQSNGFSGIRDVLVFRGSYIKQP